MNCHAEGLVTGGNGPNVTVMQILSESGVGPLVDMDWLGEMFIQ
jgi:hypothetical protein